MTPHPPLPLFGSEGWPLRPSKLKTLLSCSASVVLDSLMAREDEGGKGAQTGSVVHAGVERFHRTEGSAEHRKSEALEAAKEALPTFPLADPAKAFKWVAAYASDPKNIAANVTHVEQKVRLTIPMPDGVPLVIQGTLDQIRVDERDGLQRVWDLKTGVFYNTLQIVDESQAQQAAYVLAARETLQLDVRPGGIINAAGYDQPRGERFLPIGVDVDDCLHIMDIVKQRTLDVRSGRREYNPSASACGFCKHRAFPRCKTLGV
jgi:hypothetical protein